MEQARATDKDAVSALKHASKGDRRNSGVAKLKNVTTAGGAQGRGKGVNLVKKGKGKGKCKPKDKSKGKGQGTNKNKSPAKEFWQEEKEQIQGSKLRKRKHRMKEWREAQKKIERSKTYHRSGDPVVCQTHEGGDDAGLAIVCSTSRAPGATSTTTTIRLAALINLVTPKHPGQFYGFLQSSPHLVRKSVTKC